MRYHASFRTPSVASGNSFIDPNPALDQGIDDALYYMAAKAGGPVELVSVFYVPVSTGNRTILIATVIAEDISPPADSELTPDAPPIVVVLLDQPDSPSSPDGPASSESSPPSPSAPGAAPSSPPPSSR